MMRLNTYFKDITAKYAWYSCCVMEALEKEEVSVTKLCQFLLGLPSFTNCKEDDQNPALVSQNAEEFEHAGSISKIFKILTTKKYINFLNCDILKYLVNFFELKLDIRSSSYPDELRKYAEKHKISELSKLFPLLKEIVAKKELTLVVDIPATSKFSEVLDIKEEFAGILGVDKSILDISNVKEHCVHLVFLLPTFIADILFTKKTIFSAEQIVSLKKLSVMSLKCNGFMLSLNGQSTEEVDMDGTTAFTMESALPLKRKRTCIDDTTVLRTTTNTGESTLRTMRKIIPGLCVNSFKEYIRGVAFGGGVALGGIVPQYFLVVRMD
jgi:hypothetical protein